MTCNMGTGDRIFRAIVGVAVLGAGFYFQSWWGLVGLIPLGTSAIRWCPAYLPFGFSTASKSEE
jgi:hypothetical protein